MPAEAGPVLVSGPVEITLPDGTVVVGDRPVVALCVCRRSRCYPFCDTSHRRHSLPPAQQRERAAAEAAPDGAS
ncbi:CDGSH iron-sulfur domain-containing protein [Kitasatospora sp. NBC_01560]|uniref:CDGSH iron-sulfur domain-containing protein n=1 Tax=Kitasatospora sp. NBC_01560 TaxID=2975965 RepID=UPI00386E1DBA